MHLALITLFFVVIANAVAVAFMFAARRLLRGASDFNDVIGFYFSIIGTIYAVVLGFMLYQNWGDFQNVESVTAQEASSLEHMARLAGGFPAPANREVPRLVREYARCMVEDEWNQLPAGKFSPVGARLVTSITAILTSLQPANAGEAAILSSTLDSFAQFTHSRRLRHLKASRTMPPLLRLVLWAGAIITVGFGAIFGIERTDLHILKIVGLTTMVALILFTIWELDGAFSGDIYVSSASFATLTESIP